MIVDNAELVIILGKWIPSIQSTGPNWVKNTQINYVYQNQKQAVLEGRAALGVDRSGGHFAAAVYLDHRHEY